MDKILPAYNELLEKIKNIEEEIEKFNSKNTRLEEPPIDENINIAEYSTNVFYTHTPDNTITYMSPRVEEILGIPRRKPG